MRIKKYNNDTFILVSDIDEIPNPERIQDFTKGKANFGVFEQLFFYYKLNLMNTTQTEWYGSKICKKRLAEISSALKETADLGQERFNAKTNKKLKKAVFSYLLF